MVGNALAVLLLLLAPIIYGNHSSSGNKIKVRLFATFVINKKVCKYSIPCNGFLLFCFYGLAYVSYTYIF